MKRREPINKNRVDSEVAVLKTLFEIAKLACTLGLWHIAEAAYKAISRVNEKSMEDYEQEKRDMGR